MAEPTVNRLTLRREICRDLGMPFFRRWPDGLQVQDTAAGGTGTIDGSDVGKVVDSRFTQDRG